MPCMSCNADWSIPPPSKVPEDTDLFPFGKYKGVPYSTLMSVKPSYLWWLAEQPWLSSWPDVNAFIDANRTRLGLS
jgi:hypothetical protein